VALFQIVSFSAHASVQVPLVNNIYYFVAQEVHYVELEHEAQGDVQD
jgi:hypothetical protein